MIDIEYLLLLQRFREATNNVLTPFMEWISLFAVTYLMFAPAFVYWICDKKKGLFALSSYYLCVGVNAIIKLTVCAYRPWIRDARVMPAGDSITTATGYSFPSGHTATAAPIYGGLAKAYQRSKKWISWFCIALLAVTAFSRNYLGVHTPQDVLVALLEGIVSIYVMTRIFRYVEEKPEREDLLLLFEFLFAIAGLIYITYKPYPMEYINGELIVDPRKMMNDGYGDLALLLFFPVARYIEKRWINFEPVGLNTKGLIATVCGFVPFFLIREYLNPYLISQFGSHLGKFLGNAALVTFFIALYPLVIKLFFNGKEKE